MLETKYKYKGGREKVVVKFYLRRNKLMLKWHDVIESAKIILFDTK